VTTSGGTAAEILLGGLGDDILSGGGGADSIRGGVGDDTLTVPDLAFRSVDGGGGSDTLVLLGSGQDFDFTLLADTKISNIETVDVTGSGDNDLTLGFPDIAALNDGDPFAFTVANSHHALVVEGNAGDSLTLLDYDPDGAGGVAAALWTQVAAAVGLDGSAGGDYNIHDLMRGSDVLASVAMDAEITRI
jgi:Ca2+-binding RTX toxin-like protein